MNNVKKIPITLSDDQIYLTVSEVVNLTPFGRTSLYNAVKSGYFPKPRKFGRRSMWKKSVVLEWLRSDFSSTSK